MQITKVWMTNLYLNLKLLVFPRIYNLYDNKYLPRTYHSFLLLGLFYLPNSLFSSSNPFFSFSIPSYIVVFYFWDQEMQCHHADIVKIFMSQASTIIISQSHFPLLKDHFWD